MAKFPIAARNLGRIWALLVCAGLAPAAAHADAVAQFRKGAAAFKDGDYSAAAQAFEQAHSEGLRRPAVDYNLGSSYYRLGDYQRAAQSFRRLLTNPALAPLAHYNLGLVAQRQGDLTAAQEHFQQAYDTATDERLRYLALRQIAPQTDRTAQRLFDWRGYASVAGGYDDNVNFVPTDTPSHVGDNFLESYVSASGALTGTRADGVSVHGSVYALRYQDTDVNDFTELRLLARRNAVHGPWQTYVGGLVLHDNLGGDSYQNALGVEAGASRELSHDRFLNLRYVFEHINSLDERYDYLAGQRHEVRAEYEIYQPQDDLRLAYELELNDRRDTGLESYSPTRHSLHAYYSHALDDDWRLRADASYRWSDYPDAPLLDREDKRWRTRLSAARALAKDWQLVGQWEYVNNDSNDPMRDYERHVYSLELQWLF